MHAGKYLLPRVLFESLLASSSAQRLISLLNMFRLSSRLIKNVECVRELMETQIDFAPVNAKLEAMRAVSLNFLRNGLEQ